MLEWIRKLFNKLLRWLFGSKTDTTQSTFQGFHKAFSIAGLPLLRVRVLQTYEKREIREQILSKIEEKKH